MVVLQNKQKICSFRQADVAFAVELSVIFYWVFLVGRELIRFPPGKETVRGVSCHGVCNLVFVACFNFICLQE